MARRRLGPPLFNDTADAGAPASPIQSETGSYNSPGRAPPIARIAGQSAAEAALETLAADMRRAREDGRLMQELPLAAVDPTHLVRDRIVADDAEMAALMSSLRDRGQQMPIEVVDLGGGRYGLISGWRRLTALSRLAETEPGRFGRVLAVLRRPDTAADAYRAMVEENELRVGLSYYERARIAARAVGQGVFPDSFSALNGLFGTASRARRSKIGSFMRLYDALDDALCFPAAISERLGLRLVKALDKGQEKALRSALEPDFSSADTELAALEQALQNLSVSRAKQPIPGVRLTFSAGRLVLSGQGVDVRLSEDLLEWLARRGG